MKSKLRVSCIQSSATSDWRANLKQIWRLVHVAVSRDSQIVALPEAFGFRGPEKDFSFFARQVTPGMIREFQAFARQRRVAFLLGSLLVPAGRGRKFFNESILISPQGKIAARYQKIHLFDVSLKGKQRFKESHLIQPGRRSVTGEVWGVRTGLSVCFDLRFPELFRELVRRGSKIIFVPANFTRTTGKAHWEILLRARAIENQVFIVAPGQVGVHPTTGVRSFGTSLMIDPWGSVLVKAGPAAVQVITADLDFSRQRCLRAEFPVLNWPKRGRQR